MVVAGVYEVAQLVDVLDGMDERAVPSREEGKDEEEAESNPARAGRHAPKYTSLRRGCLKEDLFQRAGIERLGEE